MGKNTLGCGTTVTRVRAGDAFWLELSKQDAVFREMVARAVAAWLAIWRTLASAAGEVERLQRIRSRGGRIQDILPGLSVGQMVKQDKGWAWSTFCHNSPYHPGSYMFVDVLFSFTGL